MVDNSQEYRLKNWATRSSFARSLAPLTRSLAPDCSLRSHSPLRSLRSLPRSWDSDLLDGYFVCVFFLFSTIVPNSSPSPISRVVPRASSAAKCGHQPGQHRFFHAHHGVGQIYLYSREGGGHGASRHPRHGRCGQPHTKTHLW